MSDELEELEKSWDESKYDPNISLREMWDREEAYRRKKEEEDAKRRREEERKAEEERRREERRKEEKRLQEMLKEQARAQAERQTSTRNPFTATSLPKPGASSRSWAPEAQGDPRPQEPDTLLDHIFSFCALIFCGLAAILPILCIIFIGKIIRAISWSCSHWFSVITLAAGIVLAAYFILLAAVSIHITNQDAKKNGKKRFRWGLYCFGGLFYFLVCRHLMQKGENLSSVIFTQLPLLLYFPAAVNLFFCVVELCKDKSVWKLKKLKDIFFFPFMACMVWGGFFLLAYFLVGEEWAVSEIKIPLQWGKDFFSAVWQWFITPLFERLQATIAHYS